MLHSLSGEAPWKCVGQAWGWELGADPEGSARSCQVCAQDVGGGAGSDLRNTSVQAQGCGPANESLAPSVLQHLWELWC